MLGAGLVLSLVTVVLWAPWALATRRGAPRRGGEWVLAVWALVAALTGPGILAVAWAAATL